MKLRSAIWASVVTLLLLTSSCKSGNSPANPSEAQATPANTVPTSQPAAPRQPDAAKAKEVQPAPEVAQKEAPTPAPTPPPPVIVPAGTILSVRINEAVGSKENKAGDKFTASVAQPVVSKGQTLIPSGSAVAGVVEQAQQGGKIKGSSALSLRLVAVAVKGVSYPISTGTFLEEGKGKGSRTAKIGAGGAAAGAVIGGIAGGGKGALIGGLAGGGAGVAGSAFTGNKGLTIPAETVLQFKLAQSLRLAPAGVPSNAATDPTKQ